ncbi:MAG: DnaD domain protein [Clostridia bacterium]|nr:DnaD domain protein [Clostridia bacterium]
MKIENNSSLLLGDTAVSDIFINEYLLEAEGDFVKVYLYCLFLSKHSKEISMLDLSKKTGLQIDRVKAAIEYFNRVGIMVSSPKGILLCDLKEKEINRLYHPKLSTSPEDAVDKLNRNKRRSEVITAINNRFFQGIMSPAWFNDIATIFDKFGFEDDVVYSLFNYCYDKHALHRNYLFTVAEAWFNEKIKTTCDLDLYYQKYEKCNVLKKTICKKLGISRKLTEYEEAYINKWSMEFGYDLDVIEIALKKTTAKTNPNFEYIHKMISSWQEKGLRTKDEVISYLDSVKEKNKFIRENKSGQSNAYVNPEQKEFNDLERFYAN